MPYPVSRLLPGCENGTVKTTVLIVDDHAEFRVAARAMLENDGFTVVGEAEDGPGALRAAALLRPALVLLDVRLPGGDGNLCPRVRCTNTLPVA